MINHFVPKNLKEALAILNEHDCYIMNGGTDLMVQKHVSTNVLPRFDKDVLYINNIKELDYIKKDEEGIHIGGSTRYIEIENSLIIPYIYKRVISGMLVSEFIYGVRKIHRETNELITEIIIKPTNLSYFYRKVGSRKSESITKVSFLGGVKVEKNIIKDFRVAFGSVAIKTVRNRDIENKYIGKKVDELDVNEIVNDYAPLVTPITDQRSNKEYRHKVAMNLLKKFINDIKEGGNNE